MRDGSDLEDVNVELAGLAGRVEQAWAGKFEEYEGWSMRAMAFTEVSTQFFRTGVFIAMGAVVFVLLLVCANTASLLLGVLA